MNVNELIKESNYEKNIKICELVADKYSKYFSAYELDEIKNYFDKWNEIMNQASNCNCWGDDNATQDIHLGAFKDFFDEKEKLRTELTHTTLCKLTRLMGWISNDDIIPIIFFKKYIDEKQVERPYIMSSALIAYDFQNETIDIYNYYNKKIENLKQKIKERNQLINDNDIELETEHKKFIREKNWLKHEENVYIYLMMRDMRDKTCLLSGSIISLT